MDRQTDRIEELLERTSRTFALTIPLLPEPTRRQVAVAYLLFRIADTFEDATAWPKDRRIAALERFGEMMRRPDPAAAGPVGSAWSREVPIRHDGYLELLEATPLVLEELLELDESAAAAIREHTVRTVDGMAGYVDRTDDAGDLHLEDVDDLREYCYVVAGIVGEMLTELALLGWPQLADVDAELRSRAHSFGEALQLVNILRDAGVDRSEGRCYLPADVDRTRVFALARRDLDVADEYTATLRGAGAPPGLVGFCDLPVRLARATLDLVEVEGPGAKLGRERVGAIVAEVLAAAAE